MMLTALIKQMPLFPLVGTTLLNGKMEHGVPCIQNTAQKYWRAMWGIHNDKEKWFSLISLQRSSNEMIVNGNSRGGFKFHPLNSDGSGHSEGCVTFYNYHEFMILRNRMLKGNTMQLKEKEHGFVKAYGTLHVVGHPDFSKCNIAPKSWES